MSAGATRRLGLIGITLIACLRLGLTTVTVTSEAVARPRDERLLVAAPRWYPNAAPDAPTLVAPPDGANAAAPVVSLVVRVADPDQDALEVKFYGRLVEPFRTPFAVVALPDTQYYSETYPQIFSAQTQWVVDNRDARQIAYVGHEGDIVNYPTEDYQWQNANAAISILDTLPDLPYGLTIGNHDQWPHGPAGTAAFNTYFPYTRYEARPWYGGHYGSDNDNHYVLFTGGGMDFIAIHFEYDMAADPAVLTWAESLLQTYPQRRAIVTCHNVIDGAGNWSAQGAAIYSAFKVYPNFFMILCGHSGPEAWRMDVYNGSTVYTVLANYQGRSNGGNGWLRILEFAPYDNEIRVKTYSPTLDQYETDANSEFSLSYDMGGLPFQELGTLSGVASGSDAGFDWAGLSGNQNYQWYATVSDGQATVSGPAWRFHTLARGDFDGDGDIDLADFTRFEICFAGPGGALAPGCEPGDFDLDNDIDCEDWTQFGLVWTGPGQLPQLSQCASQTIPAVSQWGSANMGLLLLTAMTLVLRRAKCVGTKHRIPRSV